MKKRSFKLSNTLLPKIGQWEDRDANEDVAAFFDENLSRLTGMTFYLSMLCFPS